MDLLFCLQTMQIHRAHPMDPFLACKSKQWAHTLTLWSTHGIFQAQHMELSVFIKVDESTMATMWTHAWPLRIKPWLRTLT